MSRVTPKHSIIHSSVIYKFNKFWN